jgi:hypothetical protein
MTVMPRSDQEITDVNIVDVLFCEHSRKSHSEIHNAFLSSIGSPLDTALELLRRGHWPVSIYPAGVTIETSRGPKVTKGKEPMGGKGWGLRRWDEAKLRREFTRHSQAGVGVCLGPGRAPGGGWLIDLEGDGPEAEASICILLDGECIETMGWASLRGAHNLCEADGERLLELLGRAGAKEGHGLKAGVWHLPELPDLEWRIGGYKPDGTVKQAQSVVPPTQGTDGWARRWNEHDGIARLPEAAYAFLERMAEQSTEPHETIAPRASQTPSREYSAPPDNPGPSYFAKSLRSETALVAGTAEGSRHITLRDSGLKIAGLVKGLGLDWEGSRRQLADAGRQCGLDDGEVQELLDWAWDNAEPRVPTSSKVAGQEPANTVSMHSGNDAQLYMHLQEEKENDPHANAALKPKAKHVGQNAQACGSFSETPQACGSKPEPQACGSKLDHGDRDIICKHGLCGGEPDWTEVLFDLRRELDPIASKRHWVQQTWKEVAAYWLTVSRTNGAHLPGFDSVWSKLKKILANPIRERHGDTLKLVEERIPHVIVPSDLERTKLAGVARVMIAFAEVHAQMGRVIFYVSQREVAKLAGMKSHRTAGRYLAALGGMGYLSMIKVGDQKRNGDATDWQWHDPPCPSAAVWNNTEKLKAANQASQASDDPAVDPGAVSLGNRHDEPQVDEPGGNPGTDAPVPDMDTPSSEPEPPSAYAEVELTASVLDAFESYDHAERVARRAASRRAAG